MKRPVPGMRLAPIVLVLGLLRPSLTAQQAPGPPELGTRRSAAAAVVVADRVATLRADLDAIFNETQMENAFWGVMIQSADTGEIIYQKNHRKLLMPASNMKIFTATAALLKLGPDYTYTTKILATGPTARGELAGDLIVVGSGDPTMGARFGRGDPLKIFRDWAAQLKAQGIKSIRGDLIGMDEIFDREPLGSGWSWDDLPYGYSAEITGLQFNENTVDLIINPGEKIGDPARIQTRPATAYVHVTNHLRTVEKGADTHWRLERAAQGNQFTISGIWPLASQEFVQDVAVHNPAAYFVSVLKEVLEQSGVKVSGAAYAASDRGYRMNPAPARLLFTHTSPKLSEIISVLLKVSQNLYAETLVRTLGREFKDEGRFAAGSKVVEEVLSGFGIPPKSYVMRDGSGLSPYNYLTAEMLLHILRKVYRHKYFKTFYDALPIAGVDGTIKERMKGTRGEGNVHAKTGTIANTRALSGYVTTRDGELLAFAMIANNFNVPNSVPEYVQDLALERLANFSRREP